MKSTNIVTMTPDEVAKALAHFAVLQNEPRVGRRSVHYNVVVNRDGTAVVTYSVETLGDDRAMGFRESDS